MPVIVAIQEAETRRITVQDQPGQTVYEILSQKYPIQTRAGGVAQIVEHLPCKNETLSSNPSTIKKKKKKKKKKKESATIYKALGSIHNSEGRKKSIFEQIFSELIY
jgi:hypothetical protein